MVEDTEVPKRRENSGGKGSKEEWSGGCAIYIAKKVEGKACGHVNG